ncbi:MAG: hypothetical protein HQL56_10265 [Magnetococcales bacterium]|nr:hypothetical protein [Magnetococcales bacterium]
MRLAAQPFGGVGPFHNRVIDQRLVAGWALRLAGGSAGFFMESLKKIIRITEKIKSTSKDRTFPFFDI